MRWIRFILDAPTAKAAAWRVAYTVDLHTLRRLPGNRRRS